MQNRSRQKHQKDQKFGRTIIDDFKKGNLKKGFFSDLKELYYFYISDSDREKLKEMPIYKKWFIMIWWMLKMMFFNLTPVRRIMLLIGVLLPTTRFTVGGNVQADFGGLGLGLIVLVLMLELKDKILAKDELEIGRKVQRELLPKENPVISGWEIFMYTRPANEVGGDLVDHIPVEQDRLGLILADVAGKGLGAALFMSKLQATIRALVPFSTTLTELGKQVNRIFRRDGLPNKFASMIFLEIKPDTNEVKLLNAGHFPPLVCKDQHVTEMEKGNAGIGLLDSPLYDEHTISLNKNDCLFIYSDGITEAKNDQDEFFGEQRLHKLISRLSSLTVQSAAQLLLQEISQFVGDYRQSDDISFIILKKQ